MEPWEELANKAVAAIKERASNAWNDNAPARAFIEERAKRVAKLLWELSTGGRPKAEVEADIKVVQQSIENEVATLALTGSEVVKDTFREVIKTAFGILLKVVPTIFA